MPRGGKRTPAHPAPVSGPGKFSRRTDGGVQPIREPDIDNPDLQYGDRQRLGDAQRIARAAAGQGAVVQPQRTLRGDIAAGQGKLPPWLLEGDSAFPDEPGQTGMALGPGAGPEALQASEPSQDVREVVLEYLGQNFANQEAIAMLNEIRNGRGASAPQAPATSGPVPLLASEGLTAEVASAE